MGTDRDRTPWSLAIAAQVRAERSACGWTQAEAVRRMSGYMGRSTYLRLESGERVADVSQIAQVCEVMGIDFMTFMKRASERVVDFEMADELAARRDKAGLSVPPRNLQAVADSNVGADEEVEGRQEEP